MNLTAFATSLLLFFSSIHETCGASVLRSHGSRKLEGGAEEPLVPDLWEDWERIPDYPVDIGEAQGRVVENDLVVVGGFLPGFYYGANQTYMLNLKDHYDDNTTGWVQMDDCPVDPFLTHAAHASKGSQMFVCGGYRGSGPGPDMDECYVFDKTESAGNQWKALPSLPAGRGGGGMVYAESMDVLIFALGAERKDGRNSDEDFLNVWMLDLSNPDATWVDKAEGPYKGNHVAAVDAKDCAGNRRYFWVGGQVTYREKDANINLVFEYIPETDTWEQRANMPQGTGHASSSTFAYGCGFIILGGAIDGDDPTRRIRTDDVFYYDIETDQWFFLGDYVKIANTPICGAYSDKLYCTTGYSVEGMRSTITFPDIPTSPPTPLSEDPTVAPTSTPADVWNNVSVNTIYKSGDFCPDARVNVNVAVAGAAVEGVLVTLKNEDLGIDLSELTNGYGRVKFAVSTTEPTSGTYSIESCAYDAGGTAYCDSEEVEVMCLAEPPTSAPTPTPTSAPTPTPAPLWDNVKVRTVYRNGDFCPNANVWVRVELDGANAPGVRVTLKSDELGIDMEETTNDGGRAKFAITVADPDPDKQTVYLIEGCAYDAGGTAYCNTREFEMICS